MMINKKIFKSTIYYIKHIGRLWQLLYNYLQDNQNYMKTKRKEKDRDRNIEKKKEKERKTN